MMMQAKTARQLACSPAGAEVAPVAIKHSKAKCGVCCVNALLRRRASGSWVADAGAEALGAGQGRVSPPPLHPPCSASSPASLSGPKPTALVAGRLSSATLHLSAWLSLAAASSERHAGTWEERTLHPACLARAGRRPKRASATLHAVGAARRALLGGGPKGEESRKRPMSESVVR
eukprot:scaffold158499_cov34-Tisochrysis_lutea.AAC.4